MDRPKFWPLEVKEKEQLEQGTVELTKMIGSYRLLHEHSLSHIKELNEHIDLVEQARDDAELAYKQVTEERNRLKNNLENAERQRDLKSKAVDIALEQRDDLIDERDDQKKLISNLERRITYRDKKIEEANNGLDTILEKYNEQADYLNKYSTKLQEQATEIDDLKKQLAEKGGQDD